MTSIQDFVTTFSKQHKLKFTYLKDKKGSNVGCVVAFKKNGVLYGGSSKTNVAKGDKFNGTTGIAVAINNAVRFDKFQAKVLLDLVPNVPPATRVLRDENGEATKKTETYNQYEAFIQRTLRAQEKSQVSNAFETSSK
jgi:hypothetical protein